jgi:hypothetical protein
MIKIPLTTLSSGEMSILDDKFGVGEFEGDSNHPIQLFT